MTEHKFTDEEIIKAVECCNGQGNGCSDCPLYDFRCVGGERLIKLVLPIINRQQAEIERLIQDKQYYMTRLDDCERDIIPKLKWSLERANKQGVEMEKQISTIRTEAIREFAERLQDNTREFGTASGIKREVDNLVKEMTEEQK